MPEPFRSPDMRIESHWLDYNEHLNVAYYHVLFDRAIDQLYDAVGLGASVRADRGLTVFAAESHARHLSEVGPNDEVRVESRILAVDAKRIRIFQTLFAGPDEAATLESMNLCIDASGPRVMAFPDDIRDALDRMSANHAALPWPEAASRSIATLGTEPSKGVSQRVLVTAGATGIGYAIAQRFDEAGARICIVDRDAEAAAACPGHWWRETFDAIDEARVAELFDRINAEWDGLDVLCANVGVAGPTAPVEDVDPAAFRSCLDVNLTGNFLFCAGAARLMKPQGSGAIVLTSSTGGIHGFPNRIAYAASKWGINGMAKTLAMELGPHDIRVNSICPGGGRGVAHGRRDGARGAGQRHDAAEDLRRLHRRRLDAAFRHRARCGRDSVFPGLASRAPDLGAGHRRGWPHRES